MKPVYDAVQIDKTFPLHYSSKITFLLPYSIFYFIFHHLVNFIEKTIHPIRKSVTGFIIYIRPFILWFQYSFLKWTEARVTKFRRCFKIFFFTRTKFFLVPFFIDSCSFNRKPKYTWRCSAKSATIYKIKFIFVVLSFFPQIKHNSVRPILASMKQLILSLWMRNSFLVFTYTVTCESQSFSSKRWQMDQKESYRKHFRLFHRSLTHSISTWQKQQCRILRTLLNNTFIWNIFSEFRKSKKKRKWEHILQC